MKVIFTRDVIDPACGDHPAMIVVEAGTVGELTVQQGHWPAYVLTRTTNARSRADELVGCNLDEFKPVLEFVI